MSEGEAYQRGLRSGLEGKTVAGGHGWGDALRESLNPPSADERAAEQRGNEAGLAARAAAEAIKKAK
jgi:hypothetical protein